MSEPLFAGAAALLLDAALKGSVVLLGALAATRLMRRATAASRHLVWTVALAAVVALPVLSALVPAWEVVPVPTLRAADGNVVTLSSRPAPSLDAPSIGRSGSGSAGETAGGGTIVSGPPSSGPSSNPTSDPTSSGPSPSVSTEGSFSFDGRAALVALWMAGGALLLVRLVVGLARVAWIRRNAVEITDEGWVRITDALSRRLRVGRIVTLLREGRASVPMTWGVLSPVVLLPPEADAWDADRRTVVLAHELAHVRRLDALTQWIAHLAVVLFWFNPLVWMAARRLREERERACDDAVLQIGTRPATYADHLLGIVRALGTAEGPVAALAMARRSQFEGRLLAILDPTPARGGVSRGLGLAVLACAAAALFPLAALRAARAEPIAPPSASTSTASGSATSDPAHRAAVDHPPVETGARAPEPVVTGEIPASAPGDEPRAAEPGAALRRSVAGAGDTTGFSIDAASDDGAAALILMMAAQEGPGTNGKVARAAREIGSDESRGAVLVSLLKQRDLSQADLVEVLRAMRGMGSDDEKRHVLVTAVQRFPLGTQAARDLFFEQVNTFTSDGERRYVLTELLKRPGLPDDAVIRAVRAAGALGSDGEKRYVLTFAASHQELCETARDAYVEVARGIGSDGERSLALSSLVSRDGGAKTAAAAPTSASRREPAPLRGGARMWNGTYERKDGRNGAPRLVTIVARQVRIGESQGEVRGFGPGGSLRVEEAMGGRTRAVFARPGDDGLGVRYTYRVDGRERPFDADARRWMETLIREM